MLVQWILVAAFFTGFLRNFVRSLTLKTHTLHRVAAYIFAILYGILFTYLISTTHPIMASLWFGLIVALIISNKMNGFAHILGLATVISILGLQGLSKLHWEFFFVFTLVAVADEIIGSRRRRIRDFPHVAVQFLGLQIIALAVSYFTGVWMVFFSVVLYDIGFLTIDILMRNKESVKSSIDESHDKKKETHSPKSKKKKTHHQL